MQLTRSKLLLLLVVGVVVVAGAVVWSAGLGGQVAQRSPESAQVSDGAGKGGPGAPVGIKGIIEYTVRDASGRIKTSGIIHNTVNSEALNETFSRVTASATGGAYDGIAALSVAVGTDDPADGVLAASITLTLDGDSGTAGAQNPADGTVTTGFGSETGNGTVAVTFTATADGVNVRQIVLTKAAEDDTADAGAAAIADADIFAYVDVPDIVLNTSDTVQYTWTVDVD